MWRLTKISALNCWNRYSALNNCFGFVLIPSSRIVMTNLQLLNVNMLYYFCIQDFTELWIGVFVVKGVFWYFQLMSLRMRSNNPTSSEDTAPWPVVWAALCATGISQMPVVLDTSTDMESTTWFGALISVQ